MNNMTSTHLQYMQIADCLKNEIESGVILPGARLLSVRDMAERFGVGRQVVLSAFNRLTDDGFLVCSRGKGTFVNPNFRQNKPLRRIGFYIHGELLSGNYATEVFEECCRECNRAGYDLLLATVAHQLDLKKWTALLDGIIVTGYVDDSLIEDLKKFNKPLVVAGNYDLTDTDVCRVEFDIMSIIRNLLDEAEKLAKLRTFGAIVGDRSHRISHEIIDGMRLWAESRGILWSDEFICADDGSVGYEMSARLLADPAKWPDVIFVTEGAYFEMAGYIYEHHLTESHPLIITICNDLKKMPFRSIADVIALSKHNHGLECFNTIDRLLDGRTPEKKVVFAGEEPQFFIRRNGY